MRSVFFVLLAVLGAGGALAGQAPAKPAAKEPPPGTLHSIVVKGNKTYAAADIIKVSGLKPGQHVSAAVFEDARRRVLATELFNNVSDEYRYLGNPPTYDLTVEVVENDQRFPMRFERLGVPDQALRQYLRDHVALYAEAIPGTNAVLGRYKSAVEEFVRQTTPAAKVRVQVSNDDPKQLTVLFTPDTPAPTISRVMVSGNQAVDSGTLLRAINQVAVGAPLSDTRIQMVLNGTVKPLYAAKGYAGVTFPKIETEQSKSDLGMIVKIEIAEGPLFKFGGIKFHGSGLDEEEIRSAITFKPGQTFDGDKVEAFRRDLIHRLRHQGYLDAAIETDTQIPEGKRVVDVSYNVVSGSAYTFGQLNILGLDLLSEPAIRKLWGEKPGQPFNPEYPDFFLKRVKEQGIFDNLGDLRSDYTTDPASHAVAVNLYFKGGKPTKKDGDSTDVERPGDAKRPPGLPPI